MKIFKKKGCFISFTISRWVKLMQMHFHLIKITLKIYLISFTFFLGTLAFLRVFELYYLAMYRCSFTISRWVKLDLIYLGE